MMPVTFLILNRYPYLRVYCGPLGLFLSFASLVVSAFVVSIASLTTLQGVFYAFGCSLLFSPISIYMDEWFVERRGFAHGVMWAGKAGAGLLGPFLFSWLLNQFGYKVTMLAWAVASALMMLPTMFFMKPRIKAARVVQGRPLSFTFIRRAAFWMMLSGVTIQALGYLMPSTYMASYALAIGHPAVTAPMLIALFHVSSVPGSILLGSLGDRFGASMVVLIASLGGTLPVFLLWGLSFHIASLVSFVLLYGFFAGSFSSTWPSIMRELSSTESGNDTSVIFGFLLGGRGLGYVLAGPISGELLSIPDKVSEGAIGFATKYGPMVIFTGITAVLGGWPPIWKGVRKLIHKVRFSIQQSRSERTRRR